jgi:hypothetical protein
MALRIWQLDLYLPKQLVSITTNVSLLLNCEEVYLIQHYVIKSFSGFVGWRLSQGTLLSTTNKYLYILSLICFVRMYFSE